MNWYQIFYWVTVADGVSTFCLTVSIIFTVAACISAIGLFASSYNASDQLQVYGPEDKDYKSWFFWTKTWRRTFTLTVIPAVLLGLMTVLIPTKKDALIIIAGGTVGNFITSDSSSKAIPAEAMVLLREKIKAEIKETKLTDVFQVDTLKDKSKEELIELLKKKEN
jgi:hypothetical protein